MDGLAALRAAANVRGRNVAQDIFQQVDGGPVKPGNNWRRMPRFAFLLAVRSRRQIGWDDQAKCLRANARAVGDDEVAESEERFVFLPRGDVEKCIGADDEKNSVPVTVVDVPEVADRVDGIMKLRAAEILACFCKRGNEMWMLGASQGNHGKSMGKRCEVLLELVRWPACGNEVDLVEIKPPVGSARDRKMTTMYGIEGTAKKRNAARLVFCGGSVRLRYRQCASQEVSISDFLMNSCLGKRRQRKGQVWQPAEAQDSANHSFAQKWRTGHPE